MADDHEARRQSQKKIRRIQIGLNVIVQIGIVIVLAAMVNYLGFEHYRRWDLSRDKKYQLSDKTKHFSRASRARYGSRFSSARKTRLPATCRIC
jgi:hypothetical protein